MIVNNVKPHKISAFYLDRQKSFVPKKRCVLVKELLLTKEELNSNFIVMVALQNLHAVCIYFTNKFEWSQKLSMAKQSVSFTTYISKFEKTKSI